MTALRGPGFLAGALLVLAAAAQAASDAPPEAPWPPDPFEMLGRWGSAPAPLVDAALLAAEPLAPWVSLLDEARSDPGAALARVRDRKDPAAGLPGREAIAAALALRIAAPADRIVRREALRAERVKLTGTKLAPWIALELARAELRIGWTPEAAASAHRARADGEVVGYGESFLDAADLLRAEALLGARRFDQARPLYERLASSPADVLRDAAALRRLDLRFERGEPVEYDEALNRVAQHGIDVSGWAPRAAEAALRAGHLSTAEAHFAEFLAASPPSRTSALAKIRLGDLLAHRGDTRRARECWVDVETEHAGRPLGRLAGIRIAGLDLEAGEADKAHARLLEASSSSHARVSAWANAVRGRAALAAGRIDEAFVALGRASRLGDANPVAVRTRTDLERTVEAAVEASYRDDGCPALVLRLAVRRVHLLEILRAPGPFLRLGACYEALGLHETAHGLYRSIPRIHGPQVAAEVALPLARSGLASGDVRATRTRALAYAVQPDAPAEWTRLLAEASVAAGEPGPAAEVLASLVRNHEEMARDPRVLRLLARTAIDSGVGLEIHSLVEQQLGSLPEGLEPAAGEAAGDAALLVATALRRAGETARALALYEQASARLPQGWRLAEARYWLARGGRTGAAHEFDPTSSPGAGELVRLVDHAHALVALRARIASHGGVPPAEVAP